MPADKLWEQARVVYRQMVQRVGTDTQEPVLKWLCSRLAQTFRVTEAAMRIRLADELSVEKEVRAALHRGYSNLP